MGHIHTQKGEFDYTVAGYLVNKGRVLLIKHKYLPIWTAPAGHVELNESPIDALYKEIAEESGISSSHLRLVETQPKAGHISRSTSATYIPLPFSMEYHNITDDHRHINMAYNLQCDTDVVAPAEGESQTYGWFSAEDLRTFTETNESIRNEAIFALEFLEGKVS